MNLNSLKISCVVFGTVLALSAVSAMAVPSSPFPDSGQVAIVVPSSPFPDSGQVAFVVPSRRMSRA